MEYVLFGLGLITGIGGLICFIMVVIEMFKREQQAMGVVCIVGIFCGIGSLIALIFGWVKAKEWNISKLMTIYTVCFVASCVLYGAGYAIMIPKMMDEIQNELNNIDMDNMNMDNMDMDVN